MLVKWNDATYLERYNSKVLQFVPADRFEDWTEAHR